MARIYFTRIGITGVAMPERGGTLFVGLHRNGGIDVCVYETVLRDPVLVVGARWQRGIARAFVDGIALVRNATPEGHRSNDAAIARCVDHLGAGRDVLMFPEGTSSLGPRPLPVRRGAALIVNACVERGITVRIVPLGVHYCDGPAFRSAVEVVVGEAIDTRVAHAMRPQCQIETLRRRIEEALHRVGTWFDDPEMQSICESWAGLATATSPGNYVRCLRRLSEPRYAARRCVLRSLTCEAHARGAWFHHGAPSPCTRMFDIPVCAVLGGLVLLAAIANGPPLAAAFVAARRFADDRNVIALWRLLAGVPMLIVWTPLVLGLALAFAGPIAVASASLVTWLGILSWDRARASACGLWNRITVPDLEARIRSARDQIRREMTP